VISQKGARRFLFVLLIGCALFALFACGGGVPPAIRDELARAPRGTVTVISFTDFQCPFCRRTHAALAPLVAEREGRVRVVLRHVPLRMHPDARNAARAAVCTESLPSHDAIADALYEAPDLGDEACEQIALANGADRAAYEKCVVDPATEARIDSDTAMFRALGGSGVPMLYVDTTLLDGAQTRSALAAAIDAAMHRTAAR
jgi:protein-disulfide isomerase